MIEPEQVSFRAGDGTLRGTLTLPGADSRAPWALLVPGWLPRDRDGAWDRVRHAGWFAAPTPSEARGLFSRLADALADRGMATLRFDPRGCGESDGRWESSDLFARIDDARDAIGAMRSRRELDLRRTAVIGLGEGAIVAISVAIGDPAIGAVGLIGAPARSARDVIRRGVATRARSGADREHPIVAALDDAAEELIARAERRELSMRVRIGGDDVDVGLAAVEQAIHTPALALATMLHRPVVLAHGLDDAWVDVAESRILRDVLVEGGNAPLLHEVPGAGHDLSGAADDVIAELAEALVQRLQPRDLPPVLVAIEEMTDGR